MKKLFIALGLLALSFAIGITFLVVKGENLLRHAGETYGSTFLQTSVEVGGVSLSPIKGKAAVRNIAIGQPEGFGHGDSFALDRLSIELAPLSLLSDHVQISTILIDKPTLNLVLHGTDSNFDALLNSLPTPAEDQPTSPMRVSIADLRLNALQLTILSDKLGERQVSLADIHIENIGVDEMGVPPQEALRIVMEALKPQITKALVELGLKSKIEGELDKQLEKQLGDKAGGVKDALKSLFKKKKTNN